MLAGRPPRLGAGPARYTFYLPTMPLVSNITVPFVIQNPSLVAVLFRTNHLGAGFNEFRSALRGFCQAHTQQVLFFSIGPYRLVVRTSRRGRDNPGSTPGEDIFQMGSWLRLPKSI